ncbi:MAG: polysaccharide biosynthesis/export family protein [Erythrobacter sp.]
MFNKFKYLLAIAAAASLAGCATDRTFGAASQIEVTNLEQLPPPSGGVFYTIGPQEKLEIEVVGAGGLSGTFLTDATGSVSYPLIGDLAVGGKSPREASRMIEDKLRGKYLLNPQVRVIPDEFPPPSISIGGQVEEPGAYAVIGNQTLLRAVNQAGGLSEYAKLDDLLILRVVDGQTYIGAYNIRAIQRGNYPDPQLYPNDVVMVGDSPERRRIDNLLQFVPLLSSSAIIIDRLGR